jgi:hypothetical protein
MLDAGTALISMRDPEGNGPGHLDILETELGRAYCRRTFNVILRRTSMTLGH